MERDDDDTPESERPTREPGYIAALRAEVLERLAATTYLGITGWGLDDRPLVGGPTADEMARQRGAPRPCRCGALLLGRRVRCVECVAAERAYAVGVRAAARAAGVCPACRTAPPEPGRAMCRPCLTVRAARTREMRARRVERGACDRCGGPRAAEDGRTCAGCVERRRAADLGGISAV